MGSCGGDFSHPLDLLNWKAVIDDSQGRTVCNISAWVFGISWGLA